MVPEDFFCVTMLHLWRISLHRGLTLPDRCNLRRPRVFFILDSLRVTDLRPVLRPYLATLLLLCLVRTLLPEAWVLTLHAHQHTTEVATAARRQGKALASPQHTHCHTEQFYNVAYAAAARVVVPLPRQQRCYRALAGLAPPAAVAVALRRPALRGPPQG